MSQQPSPIQGPWGAPEPGSATATPREHYRVSPNALILLGIWLGAGLSLQFLRLQPQLMVFVFVVAGWLVSVVVHEFCHAIVAYRAGDWTVGPKGYLTGDPFRYTNLLTSIILPC